MSDFPGTPALRRRAVPGSPGKRASSRAVILRSFARTRAFPGVARGLDAPATTDNVHAKDRAATRAELAKILKSLCATALLALAGGSAAPGGRGRLLEALERVGDDRTDDPAAPRPAPSAGSRPSIARASALRRWCARRCWRARSISTSSTPATPGSSSTMRRTPPGRTSSRAMSSARGSTTPPTASCGSPLRGEQCLGARRARRCGAGIPPAHDERFRPLGFRRWRRGAHLLGGICQCWHPALARETYGFRLRSSQLIVLARRRDRGDDRGRGRRHQRCQHRHGVRHRRWHRRGPSADPGGRSARPAGAMRRCRSSAKASCGSTRRSPRSSSRSWTASIARRCSS